MTASSNGGSNSADDPVIDADEQWTQVAQQKYDPDRDADLTTSIVYVLAEADGVSPTELKSPLLYDVVDVPALEDALFGCEVSGKQRQGVGPTAFRYNQYLVKVRSDGWIQVFGQTDDDRH